MSKLRSLALVAAGALFVLGALVTRRWLVARAYRSTIPDDRIGHFAIAQGPTVGRLAPAKSSLVRVSDGVSAGTPDAGVVELLTPHPARTPPLSETTNYLVVGTDRRADTGFGGLPDTIIVAVFDRGSGHVGLISVPRDLYVLIPDHGPDRINAAFTVAYQTHQSPTALLERVIEDTLALPITHTIAVDLSGFEQAVDALGGIDVTVPCPIVDDFVDQRTPSGRRLLDVVAGSVHMDGATASMYVRSRHGRSDWNRARRQQAVLSAMRGRFTSIDGITRLPELWDTFERSLLTDMRRVDVFRLAARLARIDPTKIHGLVLAEKQTRPYWTTDGRAVLLPDFESIDIALSTLFSSAAPGTPPPGATCAPAEIALKKSLTAHADAGASE